MNKYNKRIDGIKFNNKFVGSYLLTKNVDFLIENYSFVYHIFQQCYLKFNSNYKFDFKKQYVHLYPGGGFLGKDFDLLKINRDVKLITTHPITTSIVKKQNDRTSIEVMIGPMFENKELIVNKKFNDGEMTVCFSSLGYDNNKGSNDFLKIVNNYKKSFPNNNVKFISVGNCCENENITNYKPMDYKTLQDFYHKNVDIYLNLDTGFEFNGWPLGIESLKAGSVLITTDKLNISKEYILNNDPFFVTNNLNEFVDIIKNLNDDRHLLLEKSIKCQKFVHDYTSYDNQQLKIKNFIFDNL